MVQEIARPPLFVEELFETPATAPASLAPPPTPIPPSRPASPGARPMSRASLSVLVACWALVLVVPSARAQDSPAVDFQKQVRPILSDACFACHGPDANHRKGELRLDVREDAFRPREDYAILVPGNPDESEFIARISSDDDTMVMPPPSHHRKLKPEEIELLKNWVAQGADWKNHWAFLTPEKAEPPAIDAGERPISEIDRFLIARLQSEGLSQNEEADRETLVRRAWLDLTGLPPTPKEIDAFLADSSPDAYEKLIDKLLESPRYGEHMGRYWLDISRYGDTHGLHLDNYREMWPYRDWVIRAFNENKPYDEFVVEQMAGDLLPDPSLDQKVATGFNRNHVTTSEGGSIEEEVYVRNTIDRVDTIGQVFLGLTVGCARCHDHKYDPFSTKDYYSLFAFVNSIDGPALDGNAAAHPPVAKVPSIEHTAKLADLDAKLAEVADRIKSEVARVAYDPSSDPDPSEYLRRDDFTWVDDALPPGAKGEGNGVENGNWPFVEGVDHPVLSGAKSHRRVANGQAQHFFTGANPGLKVGAGDSLFAYVFLDPLNPPKEIMLQWNTGEWSHRAYWGENLISFGADNSPQRLPMGPLPATGEWVRLEVPAEKVGIKPGTIINGWAFTQHGGDVHWDRAGLRTWTPQEGQSYSHLAGWVRAQKALGDKAPIPAEIREILKTDRSKRTEEQVARLVTAFVETGYDKAREAVAPLVAERTKLAEEKAGVEKSIPTTLIYKEAAQAKPAFVLTRGEYDQKGEPVTRSTPSFLPPLPKDAPVDRLGLARWLVSREHPLTARVAVNRLWQQFFGTGLVKTADDFGAQGEPPSHPDLLDWLAVQYQDDGWDTKLFVKRLMMSAAYRQSAKVTPEKFAADPDNRLYARGPRFRLDAEVLRDQALYLGGLLIEKVGGPSVKPPQPEGIWEAVAYTGSNTAKFKADEGDQKVHRRSLYTFWKRTAPPPQMSTFDAPSRESCIVRRERTNTPLQALLLMNEPQYVDAARGLASRVLAEPGMGGDRDRFAYAFRLATGRKPSEIELGVLETTLATLRDRYSTDNEAAKQLSGSDADPAELAAWTVLCNTLLNLDEVVTKG
jgi:mono/diheme cytochrome c family protein